MANQGHSARNANALHASFPFIQMLRGCNHSSPDREPSYARKRGWVPWKPTFALSHGTDCTRKNSEFQLSTSKYCG